MYQPFTVGSKFRITPPTQPASTDGRIDLVMQRGAFGSGEHETTESCLECLETIAEIGGARVLDLGSGTGILAIAALKLGAAHAVCVDIAAPAVAAARCNCRLNGLEPRVTHITGLLDDVTTGDFDLILANIYGDVLLELAQALPAKLKSGGNLLLSGVAWEYNYDVRRAYGEKGCKLVRNRLLEDFSTLLMRKE